MGRMNYLQAAVFLRAIHQIANVYDLLGIETPMKNLIANAKAIGFTETELGNNTDFTMTLATYWSTPKSKKAVLEVFMKAAEDLQKESSSFFKLFGLKDTVEVMEFLINPDKAEEALFFFIQNIGQSNDVYFYKVVLPNLLNKKAIETLVGNGIKGKMIDIYQIFLSLIKKGKIYEKDGYVEVVE